MVRRVNCLGWIVSVMVSFWGLSQAVAAPPAAPVVSPADGPAYAAILAKVQTSEGWIPVSEQDHQIFAKYLVATPHLPPRALLTAWVALGSVPAELTSEKLVAHLMSLTPDARAATWRAITRHPKIADPDFGLGAVFLKAVAGVSFAERIQVTYGFDTDLLAPLEGVAVRLAQENPSLYLPLVAASRRFSTFQEVVDMVGSTDVPDNIASAVLEMVASWWNENDHRMVAAATWRLGFASDDIFRADLIRFLGGPHRVGFDVSIFVPFLEPKESKAAAAASLALVRHAPDALLLANWDRIQASWEARGKLDESLEMAVLRRRGKASADLSAKTQEFLSAVRARTSESALLSAFLNRPKEIPLPAKLDPVACQIVCGAGPAAPSLESEGAGKDLQTLFQHWSYLKTARLCGVAPAQVESVATSLRRPRARYPEFFESYAGQTPDRDTLYGRVFANDYLKDLGSSAVVEKGRREMQKANAEALVEFLKTGTGGYGREGSRFHTYLASLIMGSVADVPAGQIQAVEDVKNWLRANWMVELKALSPSQFAVGYGTTATTAIKLAPDWVERLEAAPRSVTLLAALWNLFPSVQDRAVLRPHLMAKIRELREALPVLAENFRGFMGYHNSDVAGMGTHYLAPNLVMAVRAVNMLLADAGLGLKPQESVELQAMRQELLKIMVSTFHDRDGVLRPTVETVFPQYRDQYGALLRVGIAETLKATGTSCAK